MRFILLGILLVLGPVTLAVTGSVPGPGKTMPRYFSGTACIAEAFAHSEGNSHIQSASLLLGDGNVWEEVWYVEVPNPNPYNIQIADVEP